MPITNRTPNPIWDLIPEVSSAATPRSTTPSETPEQLISSDTLNWLQIKQPFDLLDEIDKLRSHEISESVSLPQLGSYDSLFHPLRSISLM